MASNLVLTGRPAIPRIIPFATYMLFLAAGSLTIGADQLVPDPRWLYGVKIACAAFAIGCLWRTYGELDGFGALTGTEWLLAISSGLLVFVLWINLDQPWATIGTPEPFNALRPDGDLDVPLAAIRWVGAALVVPVMEELFWRSFVLRWLQQQDFLALRPVQITLRTSLITALLFASEHNLWLAGLLAGLIYNWLYIRTGKLWVPIVGHAVTNGALGLWVIATRNWQFW